MALTNAHIELTLDRDKMRFSVDDTSTRIFSLDESIDLTVSGWTLEEATETAGKTPYEPFLQILLNGIVLAEVALKGAASPTANASGTYDLTGTLSTNTAQMAMAFAGMSQETMRQFSARIFASTSPNPIADGYIDVWNFPSPCGPAPKELPSASAVLAGIKDDLQEHVEDTDNPHGVTPGQIGAASSGELAAVSRSLSILMATVGGKMEKTAVKNAVQDIAAPKATLNDLKSKLTALINALKGIS